MNENHANLCSSPGWAHYLQEEILVPLVRDVELGNELLEIGPGYGAATEWLRQRVKRLTAVEVDRESATRLAERYSGGNVEVLVADGTSLSHADGTFDSVGCFTVLHHVPTVEGQGGILSEALRVLRPGGVLIGSDSAASDGLRRFHEGDTYNPIDPRCLLDLLKSLGFDRITLAFDDNLTFVARKPGEE
jgi:SAM-dependent methyltransferase